MCQTLFYIPNEEIAGLPVFGRGWLLLAWVAFSMLLLIRMIRKQGSSGDLWGYLSLMVLVAAAIWVLLPWLCKPIPGMDDVKGLPIRGYGVMLLVAVTAAVALAVRRARRLGIDPELMLTLTFWAFVPGILGARAFYVIEYWDELQRATPGQTLLTIVNMTEGGLVVYGSVIGGVVGLAAFIYKYKMPPLATLDLVVPSFVLGMAIGRIGCLLNGCCYGGLCDLPWAVTFPAGSPPYRHQLNRGETFVPGLTVAEEVTAKPVITAVEEGLPPAERGLKPDEQIIFINGHLVRTVRDARQELLLVQQRDREIAVETAKSVIAAEWTAASPILPSEASPPAAPADNRAEDGDTFVQGLKIAGPPEAKPVIAEVEPGSPAARERLKPGQRILAINARAVRTVKEARELLQAQQADEKITIEAAENVSALVLPAPRSEPVHPTQIYSALNGLLLCLFLLAYAPFRQRDGEIWAMFLTLYPITRFLLEIIRTDEPGMFGTGLSISQIVSLILLAGAAAFWAHVWMKPPGTAFPKYRPSPAS